MSVLRDTPTPGRHELCGETPTTQNRRTFLRHTAGIGAASVLGGIAGCTRGGESLGDVVDTDDGDDQEPDSSDLSLRPGLQIGMGPTAFVGVAGPTKIDSNEPGGGRLVTVDAVDSGEEVTVSWRRTVEREITPQETPTAGVGEETPTPEVEVVEETGVVTATGLDDAHGTLLPMYWRPGKETTNTSAIWLSQEAFTELKETRRTAWSRDVLTRISRLSEEALNEIEEGVAEVDEVYLNAEPDFVDFTLLVDGTETTVQAIDAYDTFGNAYTILATAENPLVVKFTYDAVSTGFAGLDAGLWTLIKTVFSGYQVAEIDSPEG
ncbi:twin-arginine translocation signal domain-containing protein [Haloferax sp. S1W]|uniref:twin-arginine translocation signal domain-containing protein n=1 Tax=Haloferax sp. S1W TaxID=3377110 RepID=UPI0037CB73C7